MSGNRAAGFARVLLSLLTVVACSGLDSPTEGPGGPPQPHGARSFFASPSGTTRSAGTIADPWDLPTALSGAGGRIQPGDTLWLLGGTYSGRFTSTLAGAEDAPIIVRQYFDERATVDGSIGVNGRYTWYWGFEVANTNTGSRDVMGIDSHCPGCRFINLVVHDHSGNGLGMWSEGPDQEAYGNIIYNNGFHGHTADHSAHGIYGQNRTGTQRILDNILFNQFGYGVHVYGSDKAALNNYIIERNTSFNNGVGEQFGMSGGMDYQVGGKSPLRNLVFTNNNSYRNSSLRGEHTARLGYDWGPINYDGTVTDNYFVGELLIVKWASLNAARNVVIDGSVPTQSRVLVHPNRYEPGRANVIVYNWAEQSGVEVDLSDVLEPGRRYEVRDVQDFYGPPVITGTYAGGSVTIPIRGGRSVPSITGKRTAATGTEFAVFVMVAK
ncbi:MAG TPA: hypothetical protein VIR34_06815 [Gemmatimonadaceae bacterium]|jgi:hypothetical protein